MWVENMEKISPGNVPEVQNVGRKHGSDHQNSVPYGTESRISRDWFSTHILSLTGLQLKHHPFIKKKEQINFLMK